jgi:hypothetical protein
MELPVNATSEGVAPATWTRFANLARFAFGTG